jgi:hypothetical protein
MPDLEHIDLESIREWAASEDDVRNTDFDTINKALQFLLAKATATDSLYGAVKYALNRQQTDADFGYVAGWLTETFARLVRAEADYLGKPVIGGDQVVVKIPGDAYALEAVFPIATGKADRT